MYNNQYLNNTEHPSEFLYDSSQYNTSFDNTTFNNTSIGTSFNTDNNYFNYNQDNTLRNATKMSHKYIMKQEIYNSLVDYYGDLVFTKLNSRNTSDGNTYGLYYFKVGCMLCIDNRYLLAIVKEDLSVPIGSQMYLSNLNWISFQTRSIDDFSSVNPHNIKIKQQNVNNKRNNFIDMEMIFGKDGEKTDRVYYECSQHYPISVDIMKRKSKEKNIYDMMDGYEKEYYTPTCSLQTLLESYQCVLTINE